MAKGVMLRDTRQVCSHPWQPFGALWGAVMVWQTLKPPESFTMGARKGNAVPGGLWATQNRHGKYMKFLPSLLHAQINRRKKNSGLITA